MPNRSRTIRQKVIIPATPKQVYHAFMDPKEHAAITGSGAEGSSEVGGEFSAWGGYITAKNLELEKGRRIVQEWSTSEWPEGYPPSRLEIDLKAVSEGTELTVVQTRVPAEQADDYDKGWHDSYWKPMARYFEDLKKKRKK
jgi:activator of HSP90 ATPase